MTKRSEITDWTDKNVPNTLNSYLSILCMKVDVILKLEENQNVKTHTNNDIRKAIKLALVETLDTLDANAIDINQFLKSKQNYIDLKNNKDIN